ncbi:MAG: hypothetical protein QXV37_04015 [Candidatus Jordarchaeaceae archaeon]
MKYPFDYYWRSYKEGKCPFCGFSSLFYSANDEIIFCKGYGGYTSMDACEIYSKGGPDAEGHCKYCWAGDYCDRVIIKDKAYLCEDCGHGINFTKMELITDLFTHNEKDCKHCSWHKEKAKKSKMFPL